MRHATTTEIEAILQERSDELRSLIDPQATLTPHGDNGSLSIVATIPSIRAIEMVVHNETIEIPVHIHAIAAPIQAAMTAEMVRSQRLLATATELLQQAKTQQETARMGCFNGPCQRFGTIIPRRE